MEYVYKYRGWAKISLPSAPLMSIVLNVHPGVQLYTRVDSKKSYCCLVSEGT